MNDMTTHRAALYESQVNFIVTVKSLEGISPHMAIPATLGSQALAKDSHCLLQGWKHSPNISPVNSWAR